MNRRVVLVVVAVAAVIAGVAAWAWWPESGGDAQARIPAGPYLVRLAGPLRPGANTVDLDVTDRQSAPAEPTRVTVAPAMPQMGHAVPPAPAEAMGPGRYRATVELPMSGQWEITVDLSGPAGTGTATFSVQAT
ncbi:hypothetical protein BJY24_003966 [Nocardia transvalensis]|uniref:YtkA-like domain-containing protein n=1 Tax=Nocardia transvalensis TaxID=37333 RepID=A0A7W9PF93_9NOCA|nr:FixH family protein [Nocardia transvalensis]MBB5915099.1 hypothetical protein [Nocardia transvalensis]